MSSGVPICCSLAAVHDDDGVGHSQGLFLIVGGVNEGDVHLALQALEFQLHLLAQLEVQGAQRLVEKQDLRLIDQAAGDGHALLLAAGHLPMLRRSKPFRPTTSSISRTLRRMVSSSIFLRRRPKATFSKTFRWGNSAYFWNTVFTGACRAVRL